MTLAQQFNNMFRTECTEVELWVFREKHCISLGVSSLGWLSSFSLIFSDGSVWGYSMIFEHVSERDNFGCNTVVEYKTIYCE